MQAMECCDSEVALVVCEPASPRNQSKHEARACEACSKKFRVYRKRHTCIECGASLCHRCMTPEKVCKACVSTERLKSLVEWASAGSTFVFDQDEALRVLSRLASNDEVRRAVSAPRPRRALETTSNATQQSLPESADTLYSTPSAE